MEKVKYKCLTCNHVFKKPYKGWYPTTNCPKCGQTAKYEDLLQNKSSVSFGKYKDVTALVFDKQTGQPLWLTKGGKKLRHDDPSVRYDLVKDPRGWKATGKK